MLICDDAVAFSSLVTHWVDDCPDLEVVGTANSGTELLRMLEAVAPNVVVLDHLLYDIENGSEEITPLIRAKLPNVGVVLVSGMSIDELEGLAARAGADAYSSKATRPEDLCDCIRQAARKRACLPDDPPLATA